MGARRHRDIVIRGMVFATAAEAAAHFGVGADTVRLAARRGTLHRVGTGETWVEPMPVRIRGTVYPTARAAAAALGVTPQAVLNAVAAGREDTLGLGPRCPNPHLSRPIALAGRRWPSMAAASRDLGFSPGYIAHALKSGRTAALERILAAVMAREGAALRRVAA